jgi:hypothetical protein
MRRVALKSGILVILVLIAWFSYSYWKSTPEQIAITSVKAFFENDAQTVLKNGLQSDLSNPSYTSEALGGLISLAAFAPDQVIQIVQVTPESLTHKGYKVTGKSGREYSANLVKTAFGWRFNDLSFLIIQFRKAGKSDPSVYGRIAEVMERYGIHELYQPEGQRAATVSGVREGIIWTAAERRRFKWE